MIIKKTIFVVIAMLFSFTLSAQDIQGFVTKQLQTYPKSRLLDIYKSCFQDNQQDRAFIDSILSVGKYAISHSPEYREAYLPHYRIVEKSIFENEIKPLIFTKTK